MEKHIVKIVNLKKAYGEYKRANADGQYSAQYGRMMLDGETGELWCDYFCDVGRNNWKVYRDEAIICLDGLFTDMKSLKAVALKTCEYFDGYNYVKATDGDAHFNGFRDYLEFMRETETDRTEAEKIYG